MPESSLSLELSGTTFFLVLQALFAWGSNMSCLTESEEMCDNPGK